MRRRCERIECEISQLIEPAKEMMSHTLSNEVHMYAELEKAVSHLQRFRERAARVTTQTEALEFVRKSLRPYWMRRPPAIAYAMLRLLTEHSDPRILKKDAYNRIGTFEREHLGRKSRSFESDAQDTVRRQVYVFKASANRKHMDRILERLLAEKWYFLDHPLNCDWEKTPPHPQTSR
jgi:hypothetical protein